MPRRDSDGGSESELGARAALRACRQKDNPDGVDLGLSFAAAFPAVHNEFTVGASDEGKEFGIEKRHHSLLA